MAVVSATAARRAVIAALTTVTGKPRALPSDALFRRAQVAKATARQIASRVNKRVFVVFADPYTEPGAMENGSAIRVFYSVQLLCSYAMGSDLFAAEADRALEEIEADEPRIRAALCYPGVLALDPDGTPTGLDGDALRSDAYRASGPTPSRNEDKSRVFTVTHFFTASIDILQPT